MKWTWRLQIGQPESSLTCFFSKKNRHSQQNLRFSFIRFNRYIFRAEYHEVCVLYKGQAAAPPPRPCHSFIQLQSPSACVSLRSGSLHFPRSPQLLMIAELVGSSVTWATIPHVWFSLLPITTTTTARWHQRFAVVVCIILLKRTNGPKWMNELLQTVVYCTKGEFVYFVKLFSQTVGTCSGKSKIIGSPLICIEENWADLY